MSLFLVSLAFLMGTFFLTSFISAMRRAHKRDSKKLFAAMGSRFFYRPFHLFFFPAHEYEGIFFATICAQSVTRFCFAAASIFFLTLSPERAVFSDFSGLWLVLAAVLLLLLSFTVGDYFPRILGNRFPEKTIAISAPFCSLFLFFVFPLTFVFLRFSQTSSRTVYFDYSHEPSTQARQEIIDMIPERPHGAFLDPHDRKLIESVFTFRERIAREVMVPRVEIFSLPADTSIKKAAQILQNEGYSRTPVYRNSVDDIIGVLMYKDILAKYMEYEKSGNDPKILESPIESIQKSVLYTPETKQISSLLQEFRKKKVHLAIVVDEYGGTEGIVTIEDIIEEIVGDIADEYDKEEELYKRQPDGSWIVDARMNILDVEEQLGIHIPQEGDYDTVGGYIFHCTGSIPSQGFIIHQNEFDLEIVRSNDRALEKVRIKPLIKDADNKIGENREP